MAMQTKQMNNENIKEAIKMAGQDLIDRADTFISDDMDYISEFTIVISIDPNKATSIDVNMGTICAQEIKSLKNN